MDLKSTYNSIAEDWFRDHVEDTWWKDGTDKFLSLLPKNASVLDIGCGAGVKSKYLSEKGFRVTGMDFSEKMIEIAKREVEDVYFFVGDIYELDSYSKKFDAVFAQAVLLHIPKEKILGMLEKLRNKLKQNGILYIAVKEARNGIESEILKESDYGYDYERFFSYFTLPEIKNYIEQIGLEIVWENITNSGRTNWIQMIAK